MKSAIDIIKAKKYINTIYEDNSQKRAKFYNRNRKGFPLFTYAAVKHYNQRDKK